VQLLRELIVDNFAGGGGASTGIELAIGRSVDIAINHDPAAIAMHKANHPETEHYCESVWDIDPRRVAGGSPVALCWLSPDCKHFSKAKGGKPVQKAIRGLAWVALRWAATVRPRVIMLENVEEFVTWGPIKDGYPDPKQKGRTFRTFVNALKRQGYEVDWKELRACDYGAPTIRKRFFMVARCDGKPITWPEPTHGDPKTLPVTAKRLKPWRTAGEIIDWSLKCPSIFERAKPLADNTLRRIARGIQKFVIDNPEPFVLSEKQAAPFLVQYHSETANSEVRGQTLDRPLLTLDTSNRYGLVAAFLAKHYGGNYTGPGNDINEPLSTITTVDHNALVTSHLVKFKGQEYGCSLEKPMHTVTAGGNNFGEVRAFLTSYYGASIGSDCNEPLHTVTTKDRFGLVTVKGESYHISDIGMRMLEPHELFAAQGFPPEYIIDRDADGKQYPKTAQVARCGNSVPPTFAEALVRSNLPELCKSGLPYKAQHQLDMQLV
jgi:DNA (cytosine-5)-methyltransferase 1